MEALPQEEQEYDASSPQGEMPRRPCRDAPATTMTVPHTDSAGTPTPAAPDNSSFAVSPSSYYPFKTKVCFGGVSVKEPKT